MTTAGPESFLLVCEPHRGEVSERFKEHAWKACVGETQPWVRIPPSPPYNKAKGLRIIFSYQLPDP